MHHVEIFLLVAGAVAVTALCRRRGWPAPLVLVAVAIAVSFVPGVPRYEIEPEVLLDFVLPPLLYSAAISSSYRDFRSSLSSITRLGVGLVLVTALAVALVFWWAEPGVPFAAALVLGAVVAPPDAVAATAVGKRLGLPRRVMTLLSGESLDQRRHVADALQGRHRGRRHGGLGARPRTGHVRARGGRRGGDGPGHRVGRARGPHAAGRPGGRLRDRAADPVRRLLDGRAPGRLRGARGRRGRALPGPHLTARRVRDPAVRGADLVHRGPAAGGVHVRAHRHAAAVGGARRDRLGPGPAARDRGVAAGPAGRHPGAAALHRRDVEVRPPAPAREPPTTAGLADRRASPRWCRGRACAGSSPSPQRRRSP